MSYRGFAGLSDADYTLNAALRVVLALAPEVFLLGYLTVQGRREGWKVGGLFSSLDLFDGFLLSWASGFMFLTLMLGFSAGLMSTGLSYFTLSWGGVTLFLLRRDVKLPRLASVALTSLLFIAVLLAFDEVWVVLDDALNGRALTLQHFVVNHLRNIGLILVCLAGSVKLGSGKWRINVVSLLLAVAFSGVMFVLWVAGGFLDFRYSGENTFLPLAYWFASMRLGTNLVLRSIKVEASAAQASEGVG